MTKPRYELFGGPLDGATRFVGMINVWPDGSIYARLHGPLPGFWLVYRGEVSFCGRRSRLDFAEWQQIPEETKQ